MKTVTLYRPVGKAEFELIEASGWRRFPPRLPIQPIFYPVLDLDYARQIARDWNTKDAASGFLGYVTAFEVDASFLEGYEIQVVGASTHREYWIPAEELDALNSHIGARLSDRELRVRLTLGGGPWLAARKNFRRASRSLKRDDLDVSVHPPLTRSPAMRKA